MLVSLNLRGELRVVLFTPCPDDPSEAVPRFRRCFRAALKNREILVAEEETRSWPELCGTLPSLPRSHDYNCLLILTHGTAEHRFVVQDPDSPASDGFTSQEFISIPRLWWQWFRAACDDRLVVLAICRSGEQLVCDPLLHHGLALHVLTPHPENPNLPVDRGAEAIGLFLDLLYQKRKSELEPEDLIDAESRVNQQLGLVLKLWLY